MPLKKRIAIFLLIYYSFLGQSVLAKLNFSILPPPKVIKFHGKYVMLTNKYSVTSNFNSKYIATTVANIMQSLGIENKMQVYTHGKTILVILTLNSNLSLPNEQGYILTVSDINKKNLNICIKAETLRGIYYGLQTLRQIIEKQKGLIVIPLVYIKDWPTLKLRGLIFGYSEQLVRILIPLMGRLKLNFFQDAGAGFPNTISKKQKKIIKQLSVLCNKNFVIRCAHLGYQNRLLHMNKQQLLNYYMLRYKLGYRYFTINFDDVCIKDKGDAETLALKDAAVVNYLVDYFSKLKLDLNFIVCPIVYAGTPDRAFRHANVRNGIIYLRLFGSIVPRYIPFFWTGDGVFSHFITVKALKGFRGCIGDGRKIVLWDNNVLHFVPRGEFLPCRDIELTNYLIGYVANINERELDYRKYLSNLLKELIAISTYTWNPSSYARSKKLFNLSNVPF